ncbi:MAG: TadE family protein [Candidatus Obscuribacterales bacterium]|nr:pilus assembly protein [Cyanobacteria bacterium SZAS LIN-5]RTL37979.1 MAG: pilus assembly protein [Candidatus Melainabacteria bacterium]
MARLSGRRGTREKGQSIVELAIGLIALIPIVLVVFDLAVIVIGVQINDSTCREAARVAASGAPQDQASRAKAVVARANARAAGMLSNFKLITDPPLSTVSQAQADALKPYGGALNGTVTVQTEVEVRPFVVQAAYNGQSPLKFRSQQSFPITYVVPNSATASP